MLRICFIGGYALFLILVIALMAIKVIAVVGPGGLGDLAKSWADVIFTGPNMLTGAITLCGAFIAWLVLLLNVAKRSPEWEKTWVKTLIIGCLFMSGFFLVLATVGASVFLLGGFPGEVAAKIAGYMSSPVFMELSFFFIGLFLLISFNIVRRIFEGDEFVEIEFKNED
ncbi:hypothetical protein [Rubritalea tangerina]|uniref:DUF2975 domain-containing protein n=1 Tax=Rubritalea tangerina TaxID=430798 RepID=A0ABW4Z7N5_9BACT